MHDEPTRNLVLPLEAFCFLICLRDYCPNGLPPGLAKSGLAHREGDIPGSF